MPRARLRWVPRFLAATLLLVAGCVDADARLEDAHPALGATLVEEVDGVLQVGDAIVTSRRNSVGLVEISAGGDADDPNMSALVEVCAGARSDVATIDLRFFRLVTDDRSVLAPIDPLDAKAPALRALPVAPNECHVGWLTFDLEPHQEPLGFVFRSRSSAAQWSLVADPPRPAR